MTRLLALPRYEPIRSHTDGERTYDTPVGSLFSVTTILSGSRDNSGIEQWRESVGHERADFIRDLACFRGEGHHSNIERYLLDGTEPEFNFLLSPYWKSFKPFLSRIDGPLLMEGAIWHSDGYAGTLDCIAYLKDDADQPTLLDWKTADRPCKPDKLYEYSIQLAAYRQAANYVYAHMGLVIDRALLVVAIPDESFQLHELDKRALDQLYKHFLARLQRFTFARKRRAK